MHEFESPDRRIYWDLCTYFYRVGAIAGNFLNNGATGLTGIALAHGLAIAVMATAVGAISGGHFNPAVTIGLLSARKIDLINAIGYVCVQCLGAIAAAALIKICVCQRP